MVRRRGKGRTFKAFHRELTALEDVLRVYTQMLGDMAGVEEDLTASEE